MYRIFSGVLIFILLGITTLHAQAQERVSPTPARISIPSATAPPTSESFATPTFTRTPTPRGVTLLEALESAGPVNVRAEPDINAERLGAIRAGELYTVLGRYFQWYQLQYDASPNGTAWVYSELVQIIGDTAAIPEVNIFTQPTIDPRILGVTQTWEAITQTPGGLLTATANARVLAVPGQAPTISLNSAGTPDILPTFTYPPDIPTGPPDIASIATPTPLTGQINITSASDLPPIVPIAILAGIGIIGLALNSLRRR